MKNSAPAHMWGIMLILPLLLAGLQTTTAKKVAVSVVASVCTGVCVWCVWCELGVNKHIWEVPRGMCVQVSVCVCARSRTKTWPHPEILAGSFTSKKE